MKKIFALLLLAAISFGGYYTYEKFFKKQIFKDYSGNSELRDKAINNLVFSTFDDNYNLAFYLTAKWSSEIETDPNTSSVKMEVIATQTESAKGKQVIASESIEGITKDGTKSGSISCHISRKDIPPDRPYVWIRIISTIDGQPQPPIIKYYGKFN